MNRVPLIVAVSIAIFVTASSRADLPASQPSSDTDGIALWIAGHKEEAVASFVHADWTNGAFVAKDAILGMTEAQFEAQAASDRTKQTEMQKEMTDKTAALRSLARQILSVGTLDASNGDTTTARQYLTSVESCGKYLINHDGELNILKIVGKSFVGAADAQLAKLPAAAN